MKKKAVIIVAAIMAVVAIGLGLGLGLGLERNIKFDSHINTGVGGSAWFELDVFRIDSAEDFEEIGIKNKSYDDGYFQKKSVLLVSIGAGFSDYELEVDSVTKKGNELKINIGTTYHVSGLCAESSWAIYVEVNKWNLRNVQDMKISFEVDTDL